MVSGQYVVVEVMVKNLVDKLRGQEAASAMSKLHGSRQIIWYRTR